MLCTVTPYSLVDVTDVNKGFAELRQQSLCDMLVTTNVYGVTCSNCSFYAYVICFMSVFLRDVWLPPRLK